MMINLLDKTLVNNKFTIQWQIFSFSSLDTGSNTKTWTYPIAFKTNARAIVFCSSFSKSGVSRTSVTKTGCTFTIYANIASSGTQNAHAIALGY